MPILDSILKLELKYQRKALYYKDKRYTDKNFLEFLYRPETIKLSQKDGWFDDVFGEGVNEHSIAEEIYHELCKKLRFRNKGGDPDIEFFFVGNYKDIGAKYNTPFIPYSHKEQKLLIDICPSYFPNKFEIAKGDHALGKVKRAVALYKRDYGDKLKSVKDSEVDYTFNLYINPPHMAEEVKRDKSQVKKITDFIEEVVPDKESRNVFYDWWAVSLFSRAPVMLVLRGEEGVGKSLLCRLIKHTHGRANITTLPNDFGGDRFAGSLDKATLAIGEEVSIRLRESKERMKALVEDEISLEKKNVEATNHKNTASFLLNSNKKACIPLDGETDRKFWYLDINKNLPDQRKLENFLEVLGVGYDFSNDKPDLGALRYMHDVLEKRYEKGIKTKFTKKFVSRSYEECLYVCLGEQKKYVIDFLLGVNRDIQHLTCLSQPKGLLTYKDIVDCYYEGHRNRKNSFLNSETVYRFLSTYTKEGSPLVEIKRLEFDPKGCEIKILQGLLEFDESETWEKYIERIEELV